MKIKRSIILALLSITLTIQGECQDTVFKLLKSDQDLADNYFRENNFINALDLYSKIENRNSTDRELYLKMARCYYFSKQYAQAISVYDKYTKASGRLSLTDLYNYAEAQSYLSNYNKAIENYKQYLNKAPNDQLVAQKIWQLANIKFLYEDSLHYVIKPISINTEGSDLCAVPFNAGLVFLSNRKQAKLIEKVDGSLNAPFYRTYYTKTYHDTTDEETLHYAKASRFCKELDSRFHAGPVAFYKHDHKMVFTTTRNVLAKNGERTLQLFFAEEKSGTWKTTYPFPFNSTDYSITDPTINAEGTILYFSSDMKGGFGGKDIYKSEYANGRWTKPVNVGETINTLYDEAFPFLHYNTLYFSSNGHAGLGGLDVFKADIQEKGFSDPQNLGYPLNTNNDEFGINLDSLSTHGYVTSNRNKGGYNDDIYEFEISFQIYPMVISGEIRYKEYSWEDLMGLKPMIKAKLYLVDIIRNIIVNESVSNDAGIFSITIPYFSKYKIKVIDADGIESFVSLEIPKHKIDYSKHEIVIVKDAFKAPEDRVLK